MKTKEIDVPRAFRDHDYFLGLSDAERASLPAHPASAIEVTGDDLKAVVGAVSALCTTGTHCTRTSICSPCPPAVCP